MKNNWRTEDNYGMKDDEKEIERLKEEIKKRDKQNTTLKKKVRILMRDIETKKVEINDIRRTGTAAFADIYTLAAGADVCSICAHRGFCSNDGTCNFTWRGAKNG